MCQLAWSLQALRKGQAGVVVGCLVLLPLLLALRQLQHRVVWREVALMVVQPSACCPHPLRPHAVRRWTSIRCGTCLFASFAVFAVFLVC